MGRQPHDLSRPRARAGGVGSSRCGGRLRPTGSDVALVVAKICASSASRDQESGQAAADQTELTNSQQYCPATTEPCCPAAIAKNFFTACFLSFAVTNCPEYQPCAGEGNRHSLKSARHPPGRP